MKYLMTIESSSTSRKLSGLASGVARLFFFLTIILIPFRFRYLLMERPAPPIYKDFTDFLLFGSDIAMIVLLAFWGLSWILVIHPVWLGPKFLWFPLAGIVTVSLITSFTSLDIVLSLYHTFRLIVLFLFYLYIVNEIRSWSLVAAGLAVQLIVQSVIALGQFFFQSSVGLKLFGEHDLDPMVRGVSIISTGATRVLRSYGLAEHPNILGGCLTFSLLVLFAVYLHGKPAVQKRIAPVILLGLPALFVTFSRSAWLAFFIGGSILLWLLIRARAWEKLQPALWLAIGGLIVLAPLAWSYSEYVGARFNVDNAFVKNQYENRSIQERIFLNRYGLQIFMDKPFSGIGLGASALAIGKYFPNFHGSFVPPHMVLVVVAMETGIVGLIIYLSSLLLPLIALITAKVDLQSRPILLTMTVLLGALTLIGIFDIYPWLLPPGRLWQWLIWGLWAVAYVLEERHFDTT